MSATGWLARSAAFGRSAPLAVVLLVAANLVPLAGVLWLKWDVATILTMYWLENGIVGLLNIVRVMLASGPGVQVSGGLASIGLAAFFAVHYGIFWMVHGVFLSLIVGGVGGGGFHADLLSPLVGVLAEPTLALGALALLLSHGASLVLNYIGRREYLRVTPGAQMFWVYPRVFVLHLLVIVGGWLLIGRGQPELLIVMLVVLKTGVDLGLHLLERARYQRTPATGSMPAIRPPTV